MSAGNERREHYVPRFYLDRFGKSIFVFDKETGKVFSTTGKNIAFEKGFYDLDPKIDLEAIITENENRMREGLNEIIDKMNPAAISRDARIRLSLLIALQFVRTKETRSFIKELGGKIMTEVIKSNPEFKNVDFKITMKDKLAQSLQAAEIVGDTVPKIAHMIGNSIWTLLVNSTKTPFWTSDNPVALFNPIDYGDQSGIGFNLRGIQTHFPINSKLLLIILDPTSYPPIPIKIVKKTETIEYENEFQLRNATRFVISADDDFSVAKTLIARDAKLRKPQEHVRVRKIERPDRTVIETAVETRE